MTVEQSTDASLANVSSSQRLPTSTSKVFDRSAPMPALSYERLEPYEGKLSRTVLRGGRGGNSPPLLGEIVSDPSGPCRREWILSRARWITSNRAREGSKARSGSGSGSSTRNRQADRPPAFNP